MTMPWAFHIGGRTTPLLTWNGFGKLVTKGGVEYPLWVSFHPTAHFSQLHLDGLRPTGGVQGWGCLCLSQNATQSVQLTGTIYGGWWSTEHSLMRVRMLEPRIVNVGQGAGFFDLYGTWHGQELVLNDRGAPGHPFRSGLRIEHASGNLHWSDFWTCKAACANANVEK